MTKRAWAHHNRQSLTARTCARPLIPSEAHRIGPRLSKCPDRPTLIPRTACRWNRDRRASRPSRLGIVKKVASSAARAVTRLLHPSQSQLSTPTSAAVYRFGRTTERESSLSQNLFGPHFTHFTWCYAQLARLSPENTYPGEPYEGCLPCPRAPAPSPKSPTPHADRGSRGNLVLAEDLPILNAAY